MQVPEHTWGIDIKVVLADYENWANEPFWAQLAAMPWNYNLTVTSWLRQRAWARLAVDELGAAGRGGRL